MKINFQGTMAEFQVLFYGFTDEEGEGEFQPSGRARTPAFGVVPGGKEEEQDLTEEAYQDVVLQLKTPAPEKPVGLTATLTVEERKAGWAKFRETCAAWAVNFGEEEEVEVEEQQALRNEEGELITADGKALPRGWAVVYGPVKVLRMLPKQPQADRLELLRALGSGWHTKAVLVLAYEMGSLQLLVGKALLEDNPTPFLGLASQEAYFSHIDHIAMNMVQISHMVFPDLQGAYDYSTKWKRSK